MVDILQAAIIVLIIYSLMSTAIILLSRKCNNAFLYSALGIVGGILGITMLVSQETTDHIKEEQMKSTTKLDIVLLVLVILCICGFLIESVVKDYNVVHSICLVLNGITLDSILTRMYDRD